MCTNLVQVMTYSATTTAAAAAATVIPWALGFAAVRPSSGLHVLFKRLHCLVIPVAACLYVYVPYVCHVRSLN